MKVAVIGAGINGLAVAVNLLETFREIEVTIFTEALSPNTTGDIAAGLFMPYAISTDDRRLCNWLKLTYAYLCEKIATDPKHHKYGMFYQALYYLSDTPLKMGIFDEIVGVSHFMNEHEMKMFPNFKYGKASTSIISQTTKFLSYLQDEFISLGGTIKIHRVESFDEVQSIDNFPIVINCTGLASRQLCNDLEIYPSRGQIIKINAPWIKFVALKEGHYIIPQSDGTVVLGGTIQPHNWNMLTDDKDTTHIWDGCKKMLPGLEDSEIISILVGLRPSRKEVRLESERKINDKTGIEYTIIHNYGHGGSGFTLFWGCSIDVVRMVSNELARNNL